MIPKIIHYIWLGGNEFPALVRQCITSWTQILQDYELRLWTDKDIAHIDSVWLKECIAAKKWAFASDYIRLWVIKEYGGIYLDTDCMVYRSFDDLLYNKMFIGRESSFHINGHRTEHYLTSCCFGAEAHHPFIEKCFTYYQNRHFVISEDESLPISLRYDMRTINQIQCELAKDTQYNALSSASGRQSLLMGVEIYPKEYFDIGNTANGGYCCHIALGSWRDNLYTREEITWKYKIRWRLEAFLRLCAERLGYILIKKT